MILFVATKKRETTMGDASSFLPFIVPNSEGRTFHSHNSRVFRVFGEPNDARILASSHAPLSPIRRYFFHLGDLGDINPYRTTIDVCAMTLLQLH
jgi:hypothetical protein